MAKLWEVIKAFQEGTAIKAVRETNNRVKMIREKDGIVFYDGNDKPYDVQRVSEYDLLIEWEIIERTQSKEFDFMLVVAEMTTIDEDPHSWVEHELFNGVSFDAAFEKLKSDYAGSKVKILSAVGSNENGETTILVQEEEPVDA